ncbi:hypothetical protein [Streptomyces sp. NPDC051452]|uniref:hypothetical protein n=1 Tax=Streptomyces sp. NPDC051452 TaxID=3365654 RepID=UPI0037BDB805
MSNDCAGPTEDKPIEPGSGTRQLRRVRDMVMELGVSRTGLFAVMNRATGSGSDAAHRAGLYILRDRVRRPATAGRPRADEELAAQVIQATAQEGSGASASGSSGPAWPTRPVGSFSAATRVLDAAAPPLFSGHAPIASTS